MTATIRPASLPKRWQGAWAFVARPALTAIRDDGPLTLDEIASVIRDKALGADIESAGGLVHGARILANAVLDDAEAIITVIVGADGEPSRYAIDSSVTEYTSPFHQRTLTLFDPAAAVAAQDARLIRKWMAKGVYSPYGGKWANGLPGRHLDPKDVDAMADAIQLGWHPGARIIKDQNGVIIDGHLRDAALRLLALDPDTGTSEDGEPFVEIRSFANDAARLLLALVANWLTLKHPTRKAIAKVFGADELTVGIARRLRSVTGAAEPVFMPPPPPAPEPEPEPAAAAPEPEPEPERFEASAADQEALDALDYAEAKGATSAELSYLGGQTTSRLARLCNAGLVVQLAQRRDGCAVHVLPEHVNGRERALRTRAGATRAATNQAIMGFLRASTRPSESTLDITVAVREAVGQGVNVSSALAVLKQDGVLTQPRHGLWSLAAVR